MPAAAAAETEDAPGMASGENASHPRCLLGAMP